MPDIVTIDLTNVPNAIRTMIANYEAEIARLRAVQAHTMYTIEADGWAGMDKCIEEMGELLQVFGKIKSCGGRNVYPWGDIDLRAKLVEEIGDVKAAIEFFENHALTQQEQDAIIDRNIEKYDLFREWRRDAGKA